MTKTSIKKALQRAAGGAEFATKSDIKKCLGCGNDRAAEIIRGLDFIRFSRKKTVRHRGCRGEDIRQHRGELRRKRWQHKN